MAASVLQLGGGVQAQLEPQGATTRITLRGNINEATNLVLLTQVPGPLVIDTSEIDRMNSVGVRNWVDFVRTCEQAGTELTFERCSPMIVGQMSMIIRFMGSRSRVKSFNVPYLCPACQHEHFDVLEVSRGIEVAPHLPCPKCPSQMVVDDLIDTYNDVLRRL